MADDDRCLKHRNMFRKLESVVVFLKINIKNVIKRGGHRARFHATMLTNAVIKVTFGDLLPQQLSAIIFHCGV